MMEGYQAYHLLYLASILLTLGDVAVAIFCVIITCLWLSLVGCRTSFILFSGLFCISITLVSFVIRIYFLTIVSSAIFHSELESAESAVCSHMLVGSWP